MWHMAGRRGAGNQKAGAWKGEAGRVPQCGIAPLAMYEDAKFPHAKSLWGRSGSVAKRPSYTSQEPQRVRHPRAGEAPPARYVSGRIRQLPQEERRPVPRTVHRILSPLRGWVGWRWPRFPQLAPWAKVFRPCGGFLPSAYCQLPPARCLLPSAPVGGCSIVRRAVCQDSPPGSRLIFFCGMAILPLNVYTCGMGILPMNLQDVRGMAFLAMIFRGMGILPMGISRARRPCHRVNPARKKPTAQIRCRGYPLSRDWMP
jgi:hypothetical protein